MLKLKKIRCEECGHLNERNRSKCDRCDEKIGYGYSNVNIYADDYFKDALKDRYNAIILLSIKENRKEVTTQFEDAVNSLSRPVINMDNSLLFNMVNEDADYLPYRRAVEDNKRIIASIRNDYKRTSIDNAFYGSVGADILFAALSLDDNGLSSYGDTSIVLNTALIKKRISVFEKNSFLLYDELTKDKNWNPIEFPPPPGSFAIWENRQQLAVTKCYSLLNQEDNFCVNLLQNGTNKSDDEFIELHILGKISYFQFLKVKFQKQPTSKSWSKDFAIAKEKLKVKDVEIETAW